MKTLSLAALALLLAACGTAAAPTVTVTASQTVTEAAPLVPETPQSDGEQIRDLLASRGMPFSGPASQLEELAVTVCDAIDSGIDPETLVRVAMNSGFTMDEGAAIVAASIVVVCPYNRDAV